VTPVQSTRLELIGLKDPSPCDSVASSVIDIRRQMMAVIIGTPVRFRPAAAHRRGVSAKQTYRLARIYRRRGSPCYWAMLDGCRVSEPVRLSELR
jgi:hypothetical protein